MTANRFGTDPLTKGDRDLLSQPLTMPFSGKVIRNRFCKAALSESLAQSNGEIHTDNLEQLINVYEAWAKGGSGLILTGNVMVDRTMREMEQNVAVEDERDLGRLVAWADACKKNGAAIYAQISHPGRQTHAHLTEHPVAPSAVPVSNFHPLMSFNPPRALSVQEIQDLVKAFAKASEVLFKAGFDGVELHAAHGYLISQFVNPRTNTRTDDYGGSLENRARFLREIVQAIREKTPSTFSIGVKLNSVDFGRRRGDKNGGSVDEDLEEAVQVAVMLEKLSVDFIEISGGSYESFGAGLMDGKGVPGSAPVVSESTQKREAHFAVFAERISSALSTTKVILTGGFVSGKAMADSLKSTETEGKKIHIDMVGLGRPLCTEPDLPNLILSGTVSGAKRLPKTPGGFFDDVMICGGNIRRMAHRKYPLASLLRILFSLHHLLYSLAYAKVAVHKFKRMITRQ